MSGHHDLPTLGDIVDGPKRSLARALTGLETHEDTDDLATLLDGAVNAKRAHILGLTGPPGVGKSTLTNALIAQLRARGETVGVLAVDPSSQMTHGALLGDRTRLKVNPDDDGVFVRSMAARDRLGGLSNEALGAVVLMGARMDWVIVETVGVGQSEGDVARLADTVVLCVQPGSGDALQFMKAGIMEVPDIIAVTKSDMGPLANRTRADVEGALGLSADKHQSQVPVLPVSATNQTGLDKLVATVSDRRDTQTTIWPYTEQQRAGWLKDAILTRFGTFGLQTLNKDDMAASLKAPFSAIQTATRKLSSRLNH